ncbi:MAG: hypothetical protein ACREQI_01390 [Candidatus Binataceae bacterium]
MKVHQELRIGPLTGGQENDFIAKITERLSGGWSRDAAREDELGRESLGRFRYYCFRCDRTAEREAAALYLVHPARQATSWLYVSNIVPQERHELTYDQYNYILREFNERFAKQAGDDLNIPIELSAPEQSLENWLSPQTAQSLRRFSHAANKSTGAGHPKDRERWCDFLIALHRANEDPDMGLLERWLVEEEKWSEDIVSRLMRQFEFGLDLLNRFDPR